MEIFSFNADVAKMIAESFDDLNVFKSFFKRAPLTIRTNLLKNSRELLYNKLSQKVDLTYTEVSPFGLRLKVRINARQFDEFKKGLYEIQDEASQLISLLIMAKPGDKVVDYCAGTGGKSLALMSVMQNSIKLECYDVDRNKLSILMRRAKVSNCEVKIIKKPKLKFYDWVLIDVPCSGLGSIRRDVDLNLRLGLDADKISTLLQKQRMIMDNAVKFVRKGGHIVYVTCSILKRENEDQVDYFLDKYKNLELIDVKTILDIL
ncbi:RsmB/NOP family class I SAM-dependent RNA methyltransferase [Deferribacter autotrophicus]|uniref:RsmB/NOP family class I SAM-dependent RNA methyltransferase n=1 Tax=Deferribacter autotrophicus TaxID=500465 RepID=A0A5A8F3V8_9BACT|nr:RsmB/NOP family class I SAM-dependent RNA methyltransferase [Deferribacter autotrophicus]